MTTQIASFRILVGTVIAVTAIFGGTLNADTASQDGRLPLAVVESAWRQRLERFSSCRLQYATKHWERLFNPFSEREPLPPGFKLLSDAPPVESSTTTKLTIDGVRMRYALSGLRHAGKGVFVTEDTESAFDGDVAARLTARPADGGPPVGYISEHKVCAAVRLSDTCALRWFWAPFIPPVAQFDFSSFRSVESKATIIDGHLCTAFEEEKPSDPLHSYYIDPALGCSIVRMTSTQNGHVNLQVDCRHKQHEDGIWILEGWTVTRLLVNEPYMMDQSTITNFEMNPEFKADEFSISFPPGTIVSDSRPQPGIGRTGTLDYLVKQDNTKRQITWEERHATYQELQSTKAGTAIRKDPEAQAEADHRAWSSRILTMANIIAACILSVLYGLHRYRRRRAHA